VAPAELSSRDLGPAPLPRLPGLSSCRSRGWPAGGQADLAWSRGSADTRSAEERVLGSVVRAEIIAAIRALPASYRLTVYLADVKGLSYQQITT